DGDDKLRGAEVPQVGVGRVGQELVRRREFLLEVTLDVGQVDVELVGVRARPGDPLLGEDPERVLGEVEEEVVAVDIDEVRGREGQPGPTRLGRRNGDDVG